MTTLKNSRAINSRDDAEFFNLMGMFFASSAIRKEFKGYPLNDSEHHTWFVTQGKNKEVISFVGLNLEKLAVGVAWITEIYTVHEHRGQGLSTLLFKQVMDYVSGIPEVKFVKVCGYPDSYCHKIIKKNKFKVDYEKGAFTYYIKEIN